MLLVIVIIFSIVVPDYFSTDNIINIIVQSVPLFILAFAQTLVILTEGVDLSLGVQVSFCTIIWILLAKLGIPLIAAAIISILAATAIGALNGLIIGKGKMPPFIATLGTQYVINVLIFYLLQVLQFTLQALCFSLYQKQKYFLFRFLYGLRLQFLQ
jgi:ribose transport system permease protein